MLFAERAVLAELNTIRIVLLVLHGGIVSLLALCAGKDDSVSHDFPP
jgi:hypothetical protein